MPKFFTPALDQFGPSSKQPRMLLVSSPTHVSALAGIGILLKLPGQPWKHTGLVMDGSPVGVVDFNKQSPLFERSLVGGWHTAAIEASRGWPYDLVVNDEGRALNLDQSLVLRDPLDRTHVLPIAGPALLVKRRPVRGRLSGEWPAESIVFPSQASRHALMSGLMAELFDDADLQLDHGTYSVNLTIHAPKG